MSAMRWAADCVYSVKAPPVPRRTVMWLGNVWPENSRLRLDAQGSGEPVGYAVTNPAPVASVAVRLATTARTPTLADTQSKRITTPVAGLGAKNVDFGGMRPRALAIASMAATVTGRSTTAASASPDATLAAVRSTPCWYVCS